jgi:hypothetical protein
VVGKYAGAMLAIYKMHTGRTKRMGENEKDLTSIGETCDVKAFSPGGKSHFNYLLM